MAREASRTARIASIVVGIAVVSISWILLSHNAGVAFFAGIPVGLTAWWFGSRAGIAVAILCSALYAVGGAIHSVPEFELNLFIRALFLLAVAAVTAAVGQRLRELEHSADELEAIRAALTPSALPDLSAELLTLANAALVDRPGRERELVSAVCLRLRPDDPVVSWARAGHPPPLRLPQLDDLRGDGSTFLLGADETLELENADADLADSEGVVVYTDGTTDVRRGREVLGREGLERILAPLTGLSARAMVGEVERAILAWADRPIRDDLCMLVLKPER